jgi:transposase
MKSMHYVGLDVHKKTIAWCVKDARGGLVGRGEVAATREALSAWLATLRRPWSGALEATLFSGWIYDFLSPHAAVLKVAHPAMLKAIAAGKKKNDRLDAEKICDLLRVDLLPECYMAPAPIRELRRLLRYRNLVVSQAVRMKNKIAGLLMEVGTSYNKKRLHGRKYFNELLESGLEQVPESVMEMLRLSRNQLEIFTAIQKRLLSGLEAHPLLQERVARLRTCEGVGLITALTWALEVGEPQRFGRLGQAISYCGLCSAQENSAGKDYRGPLSKMRNKHLQRVLIEAAKLAPRYSPRLAAVHQRELARGNKNRATLAVARRLVAYLLAVDKRGSEFVKREPVAARAA